MGGIDDDGAGRLSGGVADDLSLEPRRQLDRAVFVPRRRHLDRRRGRLGGRCKEEGKQRQRRGGGGTGKGNAANGQRAEGSDGEAGLLAGILE